MGEKGRVCVTGAGGFLASWLVKLLLSKGCMVHGTVRDPGDEKNSHLKRLEKAQENLILFKANLLDCNSLCAVICNHCGMQWGLPRCISSSIILLDNPEWYNWYCIAKTTLEREALKYAENTGLDVVTALGCLKVDLTGLPLGDLH